MKFIKIWIPVVSVIILILVILISSPRNIHYRREMQEGNVFADNITNYYRQYGQFPAETDRNTLEKLNPIRPYRSWWPLYEAGPDQTFTLTFVGGKSPYSLRYYSGDGNWEKVYPISEVELKTIPQRISASSDGMLLMITNHLKTSVRYGSSYILEHQQGEAWHPVYFPSNDLLTSPLTILGAGETKADTLFIHPQALEYPPGHYRISKLIHSNDEEICAVAYFDLYR
ncbi:MAG: hypothetical protein LUF85_14170 [Bacteroides sp.]|nr:hypothetical protein [Bacteroides sp.]